MSESFRKTIRIDEGRSGETGSRDKPSLAWLGDEGKDDVVKLSIDDRGRLGYCFVRLPRWPR